MRPNTRLTLAAALVVVIITPNSTAFAQKRPGGGTSSTPPGVIYFRHAGAMWQMDAAGTPASRIALPAAPGYGDASYSRYGNNQRWFVYGYSREGAPEYPQFPNGRYLAEILAGGEGGTNVKLLSRPDLEIISSPLWSRDDTSITFIAEEWGVTNDLTTARNAGVYELTIDFSSGTPQAGTLHFLADLSVQLRAGPTGVPSYSDLEFCGHSFNSNGTKIAFGLRIDSAEEYAQEIWISDVLTGTSQLLVSGNGVGWPTWSPDDQRIAFNRDGQVVYNLATGRTKTLNRTATASWGGLKWSPTGTYVVVYHWDNMLPGYDALHRFTADLGGKTELTAGLADPLPRFNTFIPVGWRN